MDVKASDTTYITIHPDPVSEINISANYDTTNCASICYRQ